MLALVHGALQQMASK